MIMHVITENNWEYSGIKAGKCLIFITDIGRHQHFDRRIPDGIFPCLRFSLRFGVVV